MLTCACIRTAANQRIGLQVVKVIDIRPHRRRRRTVQSYSPGGANVPSHEDTLAQPGEYDCFLRPPESTTQTTNRLVQPILYSPYRLQWAPPSPKIAPSHRGSGHGSLGPPESSTQTASRSVQPFLQGSLVWQTDRPRYSIGW